MSKVILAKYGEALTVPFSLFEVDGINFRTDAVGADGDITITKNEGTEVSTTNTFTDEGSGYSLILTNVEMQAARIQFFVVDQTGTKVWLDTSITIMTFGHASAQYPNIGLQTGDSFTRIGANGVGLTEVLADIIKISGNTPAADNLELQYDGVNGLSGDLFPSTQAQLSNIANTGAAINKPASGGTLNTGTQTGDYTDTKALDLSYNVISPAAGVFSKDYNFNIGGTGVPVSVTFVGRLFDPPSTTDSIVIQAYDWVGLTWSQIGILDGVNSTVDSPKTMILFANHVGTGINSGEVNIRFLASGIAADTDLYIDLLYCSYSVVSSSTGYANGSIWIDTLNGVAGIVRNVNGTADNPSLTVIDALTLSGIVNLTRFQIASGSIIGLIADSIGFVGIGEQWFLNLNGFITTAATAIGAIVNGAVNDATVGGQFIDCRLQTCSISTSQIIRCAIEDVLTLLSAGTYIFDNCYSAVPGSGSPVMDYNGVGVKAVNMRHYSGGIEIENMKPGDLMSLEGHGQLIVNANCTGGFIAIRGHFKITDNTNGDVTFSEGVNYKDLAVNTGNAQGPGTGNNQIQLAADASSVDGAYDPAMIFIVRGTGAGQSRMILQYAGSSRLCIVDRNWKVNPDSTSVYRVIADPGREHINEGLAQSGGTSTIKLNALASSLDEAYTGQVVFLRSGNGEDQSRRIGSYDGTTKIATVDTAWGTQPDASTGYVMLPTSTINTVLFAKESTLTEIKGSTFDTGTDSLEAIRNRGDAAWITAVANDIAVSVWAFGTRTLTSFGSLVANIWANLTRTITGGTVTADNMRGTDNVPTNPLLTNDARLDNLDSSIAAIPITAMRGTDGANTVVPDNSTISNIDTKVDTLQIDVTVIRGFIAGDWEVVNNQIIFKDEGGSEIARFDLTTAGVPSSIAPDKRAKV
jgi:hypothetical protein